MKTKTLAIVAALAVCGLAACSSTPTNSPSHATGSSSTDSGTAEVAKTSSDNDIVCKRYKPIGSNRTKKTCTTRAQAREEARKTQDRVRGMSAGRGAGTEGDG